MAKRKNSSLEDDAPFWFSQRMLLACMCFVYITITAFTRYNLSVAILCMVNHTAVDELSQASLATTENTSTLANSTWATGNAERELHKIHQVHSCGRDAAVNVSYEQDDLQDGELVWPKDTQALLLGSYFVGYIILLVPSGWVVGLVGGRRMILISCVGFSTATLLFPVVATKSYLGAAALRVIAGLFSTVSSPAVMHLLGNWSPPEEHSRLGSLAFAGYTVGNLCAVMISGLLCKYGFAGGWPSISYVLGCSGLVFSLLWMLLIFDRPTVHPRVSSVEKEYILQKLGDFSSRKRSVKIPWRSMATSMPVYAIVLSGTVADCAGMLFYLYIPTYLSEVMQLPITSTAVIATVPYITQFLGMNLVGIIADFAIKHTRMSTAAVRKLMDGFGKLTCTIGLLVIGFVECDQLWLAALMIIMAITGIGIMTSGYYVNPMDIAPPYAGFIVALTNMMGALVGTFVIPPLVSGITRDGTRESWRIVFLIVMGIVIAGTVFYTAFADGNIQPWAKADTHLEDVDMVVSLGKHKHGHDENPIQNGDHIETNSTKEREEDLFINTHRSSQCGPNEKNHLLL